MKKQILLITSFVFIASVAFGGGIVTNSNQSAYWVRTLVRDAAIGPDAVYFNPAGLTKMEDGFHFSLNSQTIFQSKDVTSSYPYLIPSPKKYLGDVKAPVFPGAYATWKKSKIAVSFGFNPVGGGGGAEYKKGLPSFESQFGQVIGMIKPGLDQLSAGLKAGYPGGLDPQFGNITGATGDIYFKGTSVYFGYQLGVTYQINDIFSGYIGARYVNAKNTYKGHLRDIQLYASPNPDGNGTLYDLPEGYYTFGDYLRGVASAVGVPAATSAYLNGNATFLDLATADIEVDAEETGNGFAPILGLNIALNEKLNIGLKYEFKTKLDLKQTVKDNKGAGIFVQDSTVHADMPALFALGVAYKITPKFSATAGFHYYFDKAANYGKTLDLTGEAVKNDKVIDKNYFELGLGLEYGITDNIFFSAGYLYAKPGVSADYQSDMSYALPSSTVGGGFGIKFSEKIMANIGASYSIYKEETKTLVDGTTTEKYFKDTLILGIGLDFAF